MIDSLMSSIIDTAVDGAVDKAKNALKASTTYVWTAVNKETHSGRIANLIFVNKLGQRKHVAYENLSSFIENNYVSNVVVRNGKVEILGCHLNDLPDYQLGQDGQYRVYGLHNEQWIYDKAYVYIQSQERKMQEDIQNHCLKGNNNQETQTNITSNIKAIKDISTATAITAVTAAGAASVAGAIGAGKAIYKQVNKKKALEIQTEIYKRLLKFQELIEILVKTKQRTNNELERNTDICEYNNRFEAQHEVVGKLKKEITELGFEECLRKLEEGVRQCESKAQAYNLLNEKLNIQGNLTSGNLSDFINIINNRIDIAKMQHNKTLGLLQENIRIKNEAENAIRLGLEHKQNQAVLIQQISLSINNINNKVNNYRNIVEVNSDLNLKDTFVDMSESSIQSELNNLIIQTEQLDDIQIRNEKQSKLKEIKENYNKTYNKVKSIITNEENSIKNEILNSINQIDIEIEKMAKGLYNREEYITVINNINIIKTDIEIKLNNINKVEAKQLENRLIQVESKLEQNKKAIETVINTNEVNRSNIIKLEIEVESLEESVDKTSREMERALNLFDRNTKSKLNNIKDVDTLKEWKEKIKETREQYMELIDERKREEEHKKEEQDNLEKQLLERINKDFQKIESISIDEATSETLSSININIDRYKDDLEKADLPTQAKTNIRNKTNRLSLEYNSLSRKINNKLDKERRDEKYVRIKIENIKKDIGKLNKYNKERIENSIENLKKDEKYSNIKDSIKSEIDIELKELKDKYKDKLKELGLN